MAPQAEGRPSRRFEVAETIEQVALVVCMWCYDRVRENALEVLRNSDLIGFTDADLERLRTAIRQGKSGSKRK